MGEGNSQACGEGRLWADNRESPGGLESRLLCLPPTPRVPKSGAWQPRPLPRQWEAGWAACPPPPIPTSRDKQTSLSTSPPPGVSGAQGGVED